MLSSPFNCCCGASAVTLTAKDTRVRVAMCTIISSLMVKRVRMKIAAQNIALVPQRQPTRRKENTVTAATVNSLVMAG